MNNKKLFNNKIAKGLVSLIAIIVLLSSILATSIFYQSSITGYVVQKTSIDSGLTSILVIEVDDINELNQLNEGWYEIRNGYVFYLDTFNSYVPLWIKVKNPEQQNGLIVVDGSGNIEIYDKDKQSIEKELVEEEVEVKSIATTITGKVTGLESVSGFVTYTWTTSDGKQQTSSTKPVGVTEYAVEYREGDYDIRKEIKGDKTTDFWKKSSENTWSSGSPPTKTQTWQVNIGGSWYEIPGKYKDKREALEAVKGISSIVREQTVPLVSGNKWNVFSSDGVYLGSINAKPEDADKVGQMLAQTKGKDFGRVESPKFKLSSPYTGEQIYEASNLEAAKKEFKRIWGTDPQAAEEIKPDTPILGRNYFITIKETGQRITFSAKDDTEAQTILSNYQQNSLYTGKTLELKKLPTIQDLQRENPGVPLYILQKHLQTYVAPQAVKGEEIKTPTYHVVKIEGKEVDWYVNGVPYKNKEEAETAFAKAKQDYRKAVAEKYAKEELNKPENKGKQLTGEITPEGELLLKDSKGVYKLVPKKDAKDNVIGVTLQPVGHSYQTLQKIGDVNVIRTFEDRKQTKSEIKIKDDTAQVDEDTIKRISEVQGKGVSIVTKSNNEKVVQFIDPQTNTLIEKRTFSPDYTQTSGTKTIEKYRIAYLNKETGEEITKAKYDKLESDEKEKYEERNEVYIVEERVNGKLKYQTRYEYSTRREEDKLIRTYEAIQVDQETGSRKFTYGEIDLSTNTEQKAVFDKDGKLILEESGYGDPSFLERAETARTQYKFRAFFANVERVLTEFQGLGYYATLFFEEDELLKWRDNVDRVFATLYLGTEYWSSAICGQYLDGEDIGIAYAETPQGLAQVGAHIEATRTEPIETISVNNATGKTTKETQFIYKITFNVRNGDYDKDPRAPEEMNINVVLKGQKTVKVFKEDQKIKRGKSFGKTGRDAIVQESKVLYNKVCLTFDQIPMRWRLDNKELCNKIQESSGVATTISTSTTSGGGEGAAEGDINDF